LYKNVQFWIPLFRGETRFARSAFSLLRQDSEAEDRIRTAMRLAMKHIFCLEIKNFILTHRDVIPNYSL
jgi:hypothetical protein